MATSGSKSVAVTSYDTLKFSWEESSQSVANNTTTISWKMELIAGSSGRIGSTASKNWSVTVNGTKYSGTNTVGIANNATKTLASGSTTIKHNSDGTKTFSYSFSQEFGITFSGSSIGTKSGSGSGTLDTIPRASTVSATAANIGSATKITISRASSNFTHTLTYSFSGLTGTIATKTTSTSVSWTVPTSFYAKIPNAKSGTCTITCETFSGSTSIGTKTCTFTATAAESSCKPTLNPTATDKGSVSVTLTGDASGKLIKGYNSMDVSTGAAARNSATLKSFKITCGGKSITTTSGTLNSVESGTFTFSATDSRGYTTTQTLTKTMVNYVKLTCNLAANAPTATGEMSFSVSGNYFNGSFGAVSNTLTVQYRYKVNDGAYGAWTALTATKSGNTYSASGKLTGLDYQSSYTIQARSLDKIYNDDTEDAVLSAAKKVKTTPLFDWGEDDFQFNVDVVMSQGTPIQGKISTGENINLIYSTASDFLQVGGGAYPPKRININSTGSVYVNGMEIAENKVLWEGGYYMQAAQTITLTEAVSKQANGIVLIFSAYESGSAADKNFNSFFVPKYLVANKAGYGSTFIMAASKFGNIASKYLYIKDTTIEGHADNNATGTAASGITFTNNAYVLRYVIGV